MDEAVRDFYGRAASFNARTISEALGAAGQQSETSLYLFAAPSKKVRLDFVNSLAGCLLAARQPSQSALERELQRISPWASALEMIHTSSLYHDDVLDAAATRRGVPAAHARFPFANVAVAPYHIIASCHRINQPFADNQLLELIHDMIADLERGEKMQEEARRPGEFSPSDAFDRYLEKNYRKTASIFAHGAEGLCRLVGAAPAVTDDLLSVGFFAGVMFQVRDDLLDYAAVNPRKELYKDFSERIITLPVFELLREAESPAETAQRFFAGKLPLEELLRPAVLQRCEEFVLRVEERLRGLLAGLGDGPHAAFLARTCHAMLHRQG